MSSKANKALDFNRATFVSLLFILGALSGGLIGIVGLLLAYVWSGRSAPLWETTHYLYLMRGFWIGLLVNVAGAVLVWIGLWTIGGLVLTAVALWSLVRAILSFANTLRREPMPEPLTYLF
jgi:uncharacterized membrane protein